LRTTLASLALLIVAGASLAGPAAPPAAAPAAAPVPAPPPPPWSAALAEVERLARAGALDLALARLDAAQPVAEQALAEWSDWERARLDILRARRDWRGLVARTASLPAGVDPALREQAATVRVDALLELGDGAAARAAIVALLWGDEVPPPELVDRWRRQLVRSYAVAGDQADAAVAIQRHRQDDPQGAAGWSTLEAELLLRAGEPKRARRALAAGADPAAGARGEARAQLLAALAGLRAGSDPAGAVFERAVKLASAKDLIARDRALAWAVAAEAAATQGNAAARIAALERGLAAQGRDADPRAFLAIAPGDVWDAYRRYGEALGNQLELVVGSERDWFLAASNRFDSEPVAARALSVVVARTAYEEEQRQVAEWQFAQLLARERDGGRVLAALYLDPARDADPAMIPAPIRYLLLDPVLAIPDIPLASRLLEGLVAPPEGADPGEWHLRRARVFVLAGRSADGVAALEALLAGGAPFELDRFLQVVFDMQTLGAHAEALRFLVPLTEQVAEPRQRRELEFWSADSLAALGEHGEAARRYLLSAAGQDPHAMDPWAQTARYRAAQELAEDGRHADARRQYTMLINATDDPARQAMLRHELQQLLLEREGGPAPDRPSEGR
jgi:hypothetical protein